MIVGSSWACCPPFSQKLSLAPHAWFCLLPVTALFSAKSTSLFFSSRSLIDFSLRPLSQAMTVWRLNSCILNPLLHWIPANPLYRIRAHENLCKVASECRNVATQNRLNGESKGLECVLLVIKLCGFFKQTIFYLDTKDDVRMSLTSSRVGSTCAFALSRFFFASCGYGF